MRPSATLVIPAWNEWALTRACLETLRPTLSLRDKVVVVDNGSVDGTAAGLRAYSWVQVVSHAKNLGFAAGCNSGAAVATNDVVVFLNNDTLLPARWLDGLLAPFADASVAATGPRSNFVSGAQLVEGVDYDPERTATLSRFARSWRDEHRGRTTEVHRLVGFCLAVRREHFEAIGGFDETFGIGGAEDDDLCLRLVDAGHRLLITHESFVHHHGHRTFEGNGVDWYALQEKNLAHLAAKRGRRTRRVDAAAPLLSACMIVKNEQDNLPSCLEALSGLVDEIVVYDTGSTDETVRIAREAGATVLEGYWDDDFGRARNAALAACTGRWVLSVDADEIVEGDPSAVRSQLKGLHNGDAMTVSIGNVGDDGQVGAWHNATRIFRRGRAHWAGRLHEQLVAVDGSVLTGCRSVLRLRHTGYTSRAVTANNKMERNLRVAEQSLREQGEDDGFALVNVARSLTGVGRLPEALDHFSRALATSPVIGVRRQALRFGIEALLELGRPGEALEWLPQLREVCASPATPDYLEGLAHLNLRDAERAVTCFDRITSTDRIRDEDMEIPGHFLALMKGVSLMATERWADAARTLLTAVQGQGTFHALWAPLLEAHVRAELPLDALVAADPDPRRINLLGHACNCSTASAQALALHLWNDPSSRPAVVAFLGRASLSMPLEDVLDWSIRLRGAGFRDQCPLRGYADESRLPALERLKAVAVLTGALQEPGTDDLLSRVVADLADDQLRSALLLLDELAPDLLPKAILALASDRRRVAVTVQVLDDLGAREQADAVRAHYAAA
jgi:GT2 family glycosyltransferase